MATLESAVFKKAQLRREVASVLRQLSGSEILSQSRVVTQKVVQDDRYRNASRISVYLSTANELSTDGIVEDILQRGKACFVPRFDSSKSLMEMVRLHSLADLQQLPTTKWNIRQPALDEQRDSAFATGKPVGAMCACERRETGALDLVLLPGVAFALDGRRLGHGKGYYDSFLHEHRRRFGSLPFTIGLALRQQVVAHVPTTERDVLLDQVFSAAPH